MAHFGPLGIYLSPTRIMAPPWATPILCHMKYTSVQVSYLWFPGGYNDFNSDGSKQIRLCTGLDAPPQNSDSNIGPILAPFWPLWCLFESRATLILCQIKYTSGQVSYIWFPGGYHIWPRAPCLTSIVAQEMTQILAAF